MHSHTTLLLSMFITRYEAEQSVVGQCTPSEEDHSTEVELSDEESIFADIRMSKQCVNTGTDTTKHVIPHSNHLNLSHPPVVQFSRWDKKRESVMRVRQQRWDNSQTLAGQAEYCGTSCGSLLY